ncbi:MAG: DUF3419 family protein [Rickettsiales bacterium]|jgi:hypothetical protein|nr:DUF3419 family protein [Rickettsiales bacterium]
MTKRKIDFNKAKARVFADIPEIFMTKRFSEYSPAYVVTNEDLRLVTKIQDLKGTNVLTAAGSGDHPIFYRIAGAENVDTFDISFCAKVIMDIKTAAIPILKHPQYIDLLYNLHNSKKTSDVPHFFEVSKNMPNDTKQFFEKMEGYKIFSNGFHPSDYKQFLPTDEEYSIMSQLVKHPFAFIWSDIRRLHENLNSTYDAMNLSNIFESLNDEKTITEVLENLKQHLSSSGIIVAHTTWFFRDFELKTYKKVYENIKSWGKLGLLNRNHQQSIIIQKNR